MKGKIGSSCEKAAVCVRASKLGELLQHHTCIAPGSCKVDHGQMKIQDLVACIFYPRPPVSVMRNAGSRAAGLVFEVKICKVFVLTV